MSHCYFLVSVAGSNPRKVVFELDTKTCPKTCENFLSFCKKPNSHDTKSNPTSKSYSNTIFHRIIPGFMVQGGDYENGDGTGGEAYRGGTLKDECFYIKHDEPFILSMANRGKHTAGSQFFITLGKASHLDGKHVAFGKVIEGQDLIRDMEKVETDDKDKPVPMQKVRIIEAGIGDGQNNDDSDEGKCQDENLKSKKSDKKSRKKRSKKRYDDSDSESDDDDDRSSSSSERHRNRRRHRRKKHKSSKKDSKKHDRHRRRRKSSFTSDDDDDEISSSSPSSIPRKKRKHRKRKKEKYHSDDSGDGSYDSESSSSSRHYRKRRKKHKKTIKDKKSRKKRNRNEKDDHHVQEKKETKNSFGMYGIVKESDLRTSTKVKRNFEIWMEEVKGIPQGTNVPKWELSETFKEYAEDFNTATLPHIKYYDYDKWEMEEYQKKKRESESKKGAKSDEFQYQEERRKQAEDKRRKELELIRVTMSKDKIEEMKRQSRMKAEMVNAYRVGDEEKRKKLQKRLEPDEK